MNKCIVCGQETQNKKYCSNKCKYKNMSKEQKELWKNKCIETIQKAIEKEELKIIRANKQLKQLNNNLQKLNKKDWPK